MNWMLIATFGSMLAFWVTALFILYQIRHMQLSRNVEVTMRMFEWAESNRMREALHWVNTDFNLEAYLSQPEGKRSDFPGIVIAFFEEVGILVLKRFVNEDVVLDHLSFSVQSAWGQLQGLVEYRRHQLRDERFGEHFEYLKERAARYDRKHADHRREKA